MLVFSYLSIFDLLLGLDTQGYTQVDDMLLKVLDTLVSRICKVGAMLLMGGYSTLTQGYGCYPQGTYSLGDDTLP